MITNVSFVLNMRNIGEENAYLNVDLINSSTKDTAIATMDIIKLMVNVFQYATIGNIGMERSVFANQDMPVIIQENV